MPDALSWLPAATALLPLLALAPLGRHPRAWTAGVGLVALLAAAATLALLVSRQPSWSAWPLPGELGGPLTPSVARWSAALAVGIAAAWTLAAFAAGRGAANPAGFACSAACLLGMCFVDGPRPLAALAFAGTLADVWLARRAHAGAGWATTQLFAALALLAAACWGDRLPAWPGAPGGLAAPPAASALWLLALLLRVASPTPADERPWQAWLLFAHPAATALLAAKLGPALTTGRSHELLLLAPATLALWHAAGAAFAQERVRGLEHAGAAFGSLLLLAAWHPAGQGAVVGLALTGPAACLALACSGDPVTRRLAGFAAGGFGVGTLAALALTAAALDAWGRSVAAPWAPRGALGLLCAATGLLAAFGMRRASALDSPGERVAGPRWLAAFAALAALPLWFAEPAGWLAEGAATATLAGPAKVAAGPLGEGLPRWRSAAALGIAALLGAAVGGLRRLPDWTWTDGVEVLGRVARWLGLALRGVEQAGEAAGAWFCGKLLVAPRRPGGTPRVPAIGWALALAAAVAVAVALWRGRGGSP